MNSQVLEACKLPPALNKLKIASAAYSCDEFIWMRACENFQEDLGCQQGQRRMIASIAISKKCVIRQENSKISVYYVRLYRAVRTVARDYTISIEYFSPVGAENDG